MTKRIVFDLDIKTETANWWLGAGTRGTRFARARRAKVERALAWMAMRNAMARAKVSTIPAATISFVIHRSRLMDDDGAPIAVKHLRDAIACALAGRDAYARAPDGPRDPYVWQVAQQKLDPAHPSRVTVEVLTRALPVVR